MDRVELAKALSEVWKYPGHLDDPWVNVADKAIGLLAPNDDLKAHRLNLEELVLEMGVVPGDEDTLADLLEHIRHAFVGLRLGKTEWANKWSAESRKARVWRDAYKKALEIAKTIGELDQ